MCTLFLIHLKLHFSTTGNISSENLHRGSNTLPPVEHRDWLFDVSNVRISSFFAFQQHSARELTVTYLYLPIKCNFINVLFCRIKQILLYDFIKMR